MSMLHQQQQQQLTTWELLLVSLILLLVPILFYAALIASAFYFSTWFPHHPATAESLSCPKGPTALTRLSATRTFLHTKGCCSRWTEPFIIIKPKNISSSRYIYGKPQNQTRELGLDRGTLTTSKKYIDKAKQPASEIIFPRRENGFRLRLLLVRVRSCPPRRGRRAPLQTRSGPSVVRGLVCWTGEFLARRIFIHVSIETDERCCSIFTGTMMISSMTATRGSAIHSRSCQNLLGRTLA